MLLNTYESKFFNHEKGKIQKIMIIFVSIVFSVCIKPKNGNRFEIQTAENKIQ